nr:baseplate J/gp47 family protein [Pseudoalteromonas caenipelagi]
MLAFAVGERLDQYGQFMATPRLPAASALVRAVFKCNGHAQPFTMPSGTEVRASDNKTIFVTQAAITVMPSQNQVDAILMCSTAGTGGNGFLPGEINQLTQPLAYVQSVSNIDTSSGGIAPESDDAYRVRLQLAPAKFSTAGSEDSYIFYTRSAHQNIVDAKVTSPAPSEVEVIALLRGGQIPDDAMQQLIMNTISDKKVRPVGDRVTLKLPSAVNFSVEIVLQFYRNQATMTDPSEQSAKAKVETIVDDWRNQLGRDIVPEQLITACQSLPGVYRATTTLGFQQLSNDQFPVCTGVTITSAIVDEAAR